MKITVIGTGYVGLVTGTCFAEVGNEVTCVDIDEAKVASLRAGKIPIFEPGLPELVVRNVSTGGLSFTTNLRDAVQHAEVIFLALPTPSGADGSADLSAVTTVSEQLGALLTGYVVVVNKSTVPVGTAEKVRRAIALTYRGEFDVVSNPEFLREGFAVQDFMEPDRVVIGSSSERAIAIMQQLYKPLLSQYDDSRPLLLMDEFSAELAKYAANSFLALKISFINEIANLADKVGAEVDDVARAIGADTRIGKRFLQAGIGYGGSCFPKDVQALAKTSEEHNYDFKLLSTVTEVNQRQKQVLVNKIFEEFGTDLSGKTFGIWGLAFKPDTDDIREAPSLVIIDALLQAGAVVKAYDPESIENVKKWYESKDAKPHMVASAAEAARGVDALVVATEWQEFKDFTAHDIKHLLGDGTVFDGRNVMHGLNLQDHGIQYRGIGHKKR